MALERTDRRGFQYTEHLDFNVTTTGATATDLLVLTAPIYWITLKTDADVYVEFGADATTNSMLLKAGESLTVPDLTYIETKVSILRSAGNAQVRGMAWK
jgi:hypothetical protein